MPPTHNNLFEHIGARSFDRRLSLIESRVVLK
jgi:hypothetical protein